MHPDRMINSGQAQAGSLTIEWTAATDVGQVREHNEDACHIEPEVPLFVVADGMGGHAGGEIAAKIVVEDLPAMIETRLARLRSRSPRSLRRLLKRTVAEQSRQVRLEADSNEAPKDMGTTVVLALFHQERVCLANLGDSRAYRVRNGRLRKMSRDHSVAAELVEAGRLSPEKADNHDTAHVLTRYVGMDEKAAPHVCTFLVQPGDRLLLCSDGLTDMVPDAILGKILLEHAQSSDAAQALVQAANDAGGHDNITLILLHVSPAAEKPQITLG